MRTILCLGVEALNHGAWRHPEACKAYPGTGYLPYLSEDRNIFSSGEMSCIPDDGVLIVQEERNLKAGELIREGGTPAVLMCLEAPLYAPIFYDHANELKKSFPFQILYQGGTDQVYFPSFDEKDLKEPVPWKDRKKKFCFVTANKHWTMCQHNPGWAASPSWKKAVSAQLQDRRYLAIHELQKEGLLDLYGKGWPLEMHAPSIPDGEKITVLREYALGLCIENMAMPGYVTEKIIDCIVAGVVPVYSGAPDITDFVPADCFMSAEGFIWPSDEKAEGIIAAGQLFLSSPLGKRFSYQGFAARLLERLTQARELSQKGRSGPPLTSPSEAS